MRIALAQLNPTIGALNQNKEKVIKYFKSRQKTRLTWLSLQNLA